MCINRRSYSMNSLFPTHNTNSSVTLVLSLSSPFSDRLSLTSPPVTSLFSDICVGVQPSIRTDQGAQDLQGHVHPAPHHPSAGCSRREFSAVSQRDVWAERDVCDTDSIQLFDRRVLTVPGFKSLFFCEDGRRKRKKRVRSHSFWFDLIFYYLWVELNWIELKTHRPVVNKIESYHILYHICILLYHFGS